MYRPKRRLHDLTFPYPSIEQERNDTPLPACRKHDSGLTFA